MKTYVSILAGLMGMATMAGITTTGTQSQAKVTLRSVVTFNNTSNASISCTVHRDNNDQLIGTVSQSSKKKSSRLFVVPDDRPLMYMKCPMGPGGTIRKMATKLSGNDISAKGWSLECDQTSCRANVRAIQRA